ncbi:MAG: purine-nucleoside phosphorylase, partial [Rubrivivax sp.]|nr:purine-nucleoside phosphorylase [Rubrivivax sp.]
MTSPAPAPAANRDEARRAVQASARRLLAGGRRPVIAVLLGSGWGPFAEVLREPLVIPYAELPAFPALAVGGHAGRVTLGRVGRHEVAVLAGRQHAYETGRADGMTGAVRTLAAAGVKVLVQTNAAGSLTPALPPGSTMLVSDHLNLSQASPLFGEAGDDRFVSMVNAYDGALREGARAAVRSLAGGSSTGDAGCADLATIGEGVYAWFLGPQFETPAEIRMCQLLGAQAVGMSTVPETIAARHAGLRVLAVSLLTNMAAGLSDERLSHAHTLTMA